MCGILFTLLLIGLQTYPRQIEVYIEKLLLKKKKRVRNN